MEARTFGIGQLISERRLFTVPDHQRDFAWTEDIVSAFLDDVIGAMREDAADYFAGLVVLIGQEPGGGREILDGQQRLATVTLVYSAIRGCLEAEGLAKDAAHIRDQFVSTVELGEEGERGRLILNANNREAFAALVMSETTDEGLESRRKAAARFSSERRLIEAALVCRRRVAGLIDEAGASPKEKAQDLFRLANYLRDNVRVVAMEVPSNEKAYVIFESLNDRGLDLTLLDLIKNYVFGLAGDRLPDVQANWQRMMAYLRDRRADDFLKVFWTSQFGPIPRGRLLDRWKERYTTDRDAAGLARDLADAAEEYAALDQADHEIWAEYAATCRDHVRALAILGNRPFYPIMLAGLEGLDAANMERLLGYLNVLAVRCLAAGNRRARGLEAACARLASKIFLGDISSADEAWCELAPLAPGDDDFRDGFAQFVETKEQEAAYLLAALESVAAPPGAVAGAAPVSALRVDRVLPARPGAAWRAQVSADPELRAGYANRLGNLCLVELGEGAQAVNAGFDKKKTLLYAPSVFSLTRQIAEEYDVWDRAAIQRRQRQLADLAVRAWPLPPL